MNGIYDLQLVQAICEERLRMRRREPVDLGLFRLRRSKAVVQGRTSKVSGCVHVLQSAARSVVSYLA
jgi:hypothetical protein